MQLSSKKEKGVFALFVFLSVLNKTANVHRGIEGGIGLQRYKEKGFAPGIL